jgi:hypothetical protein
MVTDVYGMKTEKQFVNTLEDNIRVRGAMSQFLSDRAQVEISARVVGILRALHIGQWQSAPHQHSEALQTPLSDIKDNDKHSFRSFQFS